MLGLECVYLRQSTVSIVNLSSDCRICLQVYNLQRQLQKKDHQLVELRKQIDEQQSRREDPTPIHDDEDQQVLEKDAERS